MTVILVPVGDEYQGAAVAAFSDGSSRDITDAAAWMSTNAAVATVSLTGRVRAVTNGDADIRATYLETVGSARLVVTNRPSSAPVPVTTYRLTGILRDSLDEKFIEQADVSAAGKIAKVLSDNKGFYGLNVPGGTQTVSVSSVGYVTENRVVTVTQDTALDFALTPLPGTLRINSLIWISGDPNVRVPCEGRVEILEGPDAGRFVVIPPGGKGVIENVQPGRFRMRASATNYEPDEVSKRFRANGPNDYINFELCPVGGGGLCLKTAPPCS